MIAPFQWSFFQSVSQCLPYIEYQLRGGNEVFLVTSGSRGYELFLVAHRLMSSVRFVYIFCSQLNLHGHWTQRYHQIRGIYNDSQNLANAIQHDLTDVRYAQIAVDENAERPVQPTVLKPVRAMFLLVLHLSEFFTRLENRKNCLPRSLVRGIEPLVFYTDELSHY